MPLDLVYGTLPSERAEVNEYASQLRRALEEAFDRVREMHSISHERQKEVYDRRIHGEPYQENDLVWLFNPVVKPGESKKLRHPWTGPYRVMENISDCDYRIKPLHGRKPTTVVHFNRLKPCVPGTRFEPELPSPSPEERHEQSEAAPEHPEPVGSRLEIIDTPSGPGLPDAENDDEPQPPPDGDPPARYPTRQRNRPDWYAKTFVH